MAFPSIRSCIICEDLRIEMFRKYSLMGVFGVCPEVKILIRDLTAPLPRLCFVLGTAEGGGFYKMAWRLLDPKGGLVLSGEESELAIPDTASRHLINVSIAPIHFSITGIYSFILQIDGKDAYQGNFEIAQGVPADFSEITPRPV